MMYKHGNSKDFVRFAVIFHNNSEVVHVIILNVCMDFTGFNSVCFTVEFFVCLNNYVDQICKYCRQNMHIVC